MSEPILGLPYNFDATTHVGQLVAPVDDTVQQLTVTAEDAAAVAALPAGSALLIVQRGGVIGERFLLNENQVKAGRSTKADIFLDDVTVSRKHAEFIRDPSGTFVVRDAGSLNGTYVNRERIDAALLRSGDEVQIGKFKMSFQMSPQIAGYPIVPVSTPVGVEVGVVAPDPAAATTLTSATIYMPPVG